MTRFHLPLSRALIVLAMIAVPRLALAQDKVKEIRDKNRAAMEDFDLNEFPSAKTQLEAALEMARKAKLERHPIAAETHMFLAIVQIAGNNDELEGIVEFVKALEINSSAQVPVDYRTPEVQKVFDKAKARVGSGGGTGPSDPVEPPPRKPPPKTGPQPLDCSTAGEGVTHTPVDTATAGKDLKIEVCMGAEIAPTKVMVFYRPQGVAEFTILPMKAGEGGLWTATVKGGAVGGGYMHYYIEARNAKDVALVRSGAKDSPHIVEVLAADGSSVGDDPGGGGDDENPLSGGGGGDDDEDPGMGVKKGGGGTKKGGSIFLAVGAGSGAGMLTGGGLEVAEDGGKAVEVNSGVAPAPFHVQVEAGYLLSPKSIFGVYGRFQVITLADTKRAATGAISGGLRFTRNLAPQDKPHLYVHVGGGFGHIRHTVDLAKPLQDDPDATRDTALQGMVHLGGGAGYSLPLGSTMSFRIETNVLAGIPVGDKDAFAINADLNLGIGVAF
ncbi:MAG: hypothetical protein IT370_36400 [Deltaproteobacteria bacterium]|nr:hypothetical protein [Deltaproteobacteria bacterium]